ncbi:MAG: ATP-binding protein [Clostridia bacterium]|nr:ATP-binding protein [Clostridia bacterium]
MKQKINSILATIAVIAILASTLAVTFISYGLFQDQVRDDLKIVAELLRDTGLFQGAYATNTDMNSMKLVEKEDLRITWIDADGDVLYDNDTNPTKLTNHLDRPEIQDALKNGFGESIRNSDTLNMNTFYYAIKLDNGTILRVSSEARTLVSTFMASVPALLMIAAIILMLCISLGHFLTVQLIKPINEMAESLDSNTPSPVYSELEPFAHKIRTQHENILAAATMRQDFTANVSHELKTPLTAIQGYAELLENKMVEPEQEAHIIRQIRRNSQRLLTLINDIIELSEIDHKGTETKFSPMNLYEVAEECCNELQITAEQRHISLTISGNPTTISGDRELIKELIENLVQNAIRYNEDFGHVRVNVDKMNERAVLTVSDNGIGIPANQQQRVFERFYRVDKSRSRETGGTGLGLAIVKHIAEIHDAEIKLDSDIGIGTTFKIIF